MPPIVITTICNDLAEHDFVIATTMKPGNIVDSKVSVRQQRLAIIEILADLSATLVVCIATPNHQRSHPSTINSLLLAQGDRGTPEHIEQETGKVSRRMTGLGPERSHGVELLTSFWSGEGVKSGFIVIIIPAAEPLPVVGPRLLFGIEIRPIRQKPDTQTRKPVVVVHCRLNQHPITNLKLAEQFEHPSSNEQLFCYFRTAHYINNSQYCQ